MSEATEPLHTGSCSLQVVYEHGIGLDVGHDPVEEDNRSPACQKTGDVVGRAVADRSDDEAVNTLLVQDPHRGPLEGHVLVAVGDDHLQAGLVSHIRSTTQCLGEEHVADIGRHER